MNKFLRLTLVMLVAMVSSMSFAQTTVTFTAGTDTSTGTSITKDGITVALSNGTLSRTDNYRVYKNATITLSSTVGNITNVVFTCTSSNPASNLTDATVGTYDGTTGTWTGDAASLTLTASVAQARITKIEVTYTPTGGTTVEAPTISGDTPFAESTTVTITVPDGTTVYYTTDGSEPSDQGDDYSEPFTITETTTVKAAAYDNEGSKSAVVEKTFTKQIVTTGAGTEASPYTCADVIALVNGNQAPSNNVYVKGKVSTASTDTQANITKFGNATFYISDDGTTNAQVEAFRSKNLNNEKYTSTSELPQLGDDVVLLGKPTLYNGTVELASGNYLISITRNNVKVDTLSFTASEALAQLSAGTQPSGVCYITGIISQDVDTTGVARYGNLTYYISDDGTETNQLEVYHGKSFNGDKFTSDFYLKKGDKVRILGTLVNYTSGSTTTPEVTSNSVLIELNGTTTGISTIKASEKADLNAPAYNLAGQRVGKDYKGVVIQNGRKVIRK